MIHKAYQYYEALNLCAGYLLIQMQISFKTLLIMLAKI